MIGFFIKNDLKKWGTYLLNLNWPFEGTHLMSFFGGTKCWAFPPTIMNIHGFLYQSTTSVGYLFGVKLLSDLLILLEPHRFQEYILTRSFQLLTLPCLQFLEKNAIAAKNPWAADYSDQNNTYHHRVANPPLRSRARCRADLHCRSISRCLKKAFFWCTTISARVGMDLLKVFNHGLEVLL